MRRKIDVLYQVCVRAHIKACPQLSADVPHSAAELRVAVAIADIELPCDFVLLREGHYIAELVVGYRFAD